MAASTAAAQVFATTELLEQILIQVGLDTYDKDPEFQEPAKHLFVLQRVDRTFQAVITGSSRLQGLMCMSENTLYPQYAHAAMKWLFRQIYGRVPVIQNVTYSSLAVLTVRSELPRLTRRDWHWEQLETFHGLRPPSWVPSWHRMIVPPVVLSLHRQSRLVKKSSTLWKVYDGNEYHW